MHEQLTKLHAMLLDGSIDEATRLCDQLIAEAAQQDAPSTDGANHGG